MPGRMKDECIFEVPSNVSDGAMVGEELAERRTCQALGGLQGLPNVCDARSAPFNAQ